MRISPIFTSQYTQTPQNKRKQNFGELDDCGGNGFGWSFANPLDRRKQDIYREYSRKIDMLSNTALAAGMNNTTHRKEVEKLQKQRDFEIRQLDRCY